ncbi:unnamed protein product [Rotaria sordida]|uniref:Apple domain-containing protein n=1 Tax=Rotaria sordida TaxID=392033 RepID=A0A819H5Z6_9BILA|nr:unnamed protein product [Rotaria sordida]
MSSARAIQWTKDNWAFGCDFVGNDLSNVQIRGEDCGLKCVQTQDCTHFTWTQWNGGTCWLKKGPISKNQAVKTDDNTMVCGVVGDSETGIGPTPAGGSIGPLLNRVLATRHGAREAGACALPASSYAIVHPVALGNIEALKHLKFRPDLCGQVLRVNCGNGPLDIIVTNSNLGGGLDLYASTWDKLTNNKPPGETSCTVQLTSRNAFNFNGPRCFYKPGTDYNNAYYHNVGLLNTNGRIISRATIDNRLGEHRGANPYYAFNFGPLDANKQVVFTFEDGSTHSVFLRECEYQQSEHLWS